MKLSNLKNVGIAIVIGALGSALWNFITDYLAPRITTYFINASASFSENIFRQIAANDPVFLQQTTYSLVFLICIILICFIATAFYIYIFRTKIEMSIEKTRIINLGQKIFGKDANINSVEDPETDIEQDYDDIVKDFEKSEKFFKRVSLVGTTVMAIIVVLSLISFSVTTSKTKYIYDSISYFNYLLRVNSLNLDEKTERKYISRFTQIQNSNDYMTIILELEKLALENNLYIRVNLSIRNTEDILKDHPNTKILE